MPYVECKDINNFKEWVGEILTDIKRGRFIAIKTERNEVFIYPTVTTAGLIKPFITNLTDKEMNELVGWLRERGINMRECTAFFIDDRKDPREIRREE